MVALSFISGLPTGAMIVFGFMERKPMLIISGVLWFVVSQVIIHVIANGV